jgi:hypothetical protein
MAHACSIGSDVTLRHAHVLRHCRAWNKTGTAAEAVRYVDNRG